MATKENAGLPLTKMVSGGTNNAKRLWFTISSLYCGPQQIGIYLSLCIANFESTN